MINELDDVLRQLLLREMAVKNNRIDITFDQPKREWSTRLNRPTLNLFLYDVRENNKLRQTQPAWTRRPNGDGQLESHRRPVRVDLHYMLTVWATEPDDEHYLLTLALLALFRTAEVPADLLPESLQDQPVPIALMVAQEDTLRNPAEVWSAMDNELRPSIPLVITLALNPYLPIPERVVRTRELRFGPAQYPAEQRLDQTTPPDVFWTIGGTLHSDEPISKLQVVLVERGIEVPLQPEGRFSIGNLKEGNYTLEVSTQGKKPRQYKIKVPSPDYDFEI
ncbi:MAG TPA: Pvc16 family protein [Anaerolineae bacterium]|nr:Pvc16 family protein [Anaerolineae bacterium]